VRRGKGRGGMSGESLTLLLLAGMPLVVPEVNGILPGVLDSAL
jgi:hypothetical protein